MSSFLQRYDKMADQAAAAVIASYSTSFSLSTKLLAPSVRRDICNLYAMVRIADEIVDGTGQASGIDVTAALADYEQQVRQAPALRFHTDPVIHAYAQTARRCDFRDEHIAAFFASMRADLTQHSYSDQDLGQYIYGSAEVIGLLCLAVFYADQPTKPADYAEIEEGARALGAAFQKVNFLRDFAEDTSTLGRAYFSGIGDDFSESGTAPERIDNATKARIISEIRAEIATARRVIPRLPRSARAGVWAATDLFSELTDTLDSMDAEELVSRRASVGWRRKVLLVTRAAAKAFRHG